MGIDTMVAMVMVGIGVLFSTGERYVMTIFGVLSFAQQGMSLCLDVFLMSSSPVLVFRCVPNVLLPSPCFDVFLMSSSPVPVFRCVPHVLLPSPCVLMSSSSVPVS